MIRDLDEAPVGRTIDAIYDAAASPSLWPTALERVASLFHSGFVDIFTRSQDRTSFSGLAHGLDRADYDDNFLGFWFRRNVWGLTAPVRVAGEVVSTRRLVDPAELRRSDIYNDYLDPRGLHEGLRVSLRVDDDEIQDVSILRPWSRGPFGPDEEALGRLLLPHLQRAAAITRRLREADFRLDTGQGGPEAGRLAAVAVDGAGAPIWTNGAAERMLADGAVIGVVAGRLRSASPACSLALRDAVARAVGKTGAARLGASLPILVAGREVASAAVVPVSNPADWTTARPPAAVVFVRLPPAPSASRARLRAVFHLTAAEADLAQALMEGRSLREIAAARGRSINTLRNHLARLMEKTGTRKQADLLRLLDRTADLATR